MTKLQTVSVTSAMTSRAEFKQLEKPDPVSIILGKEASLNRSCHFVTIVKVS